MTALARSRRHILRLVSGVALSCCLADCTVVPVYRPVKKPKPVTTVAIKSNGNLPPMPDPKANNATRAGIDTFGTGIRDDVHIWIYKNYTTTVKRTILMTMAKTLQDVMVETPKTTEEAKQLEKAYKDAAMMFKVVRGLKQSEAHEMDELLYQQTVNTPDRLKAYLQYNLLLSGGKSSH